MITGDQIREARQLLGWSTRTLARQARRVELAVHQAESGTLPDKTARQVSDTLERTLKAAGVLFIAESGDGPGLRLRKPA